jgi:hypothetical protein
MPKLSIPRMAAANLAIGRCIGTYAEEITPVVNELKSQTCVAKGSHIEVAAILSGHKPAIN